MGPCEPDWEGFPGEMRVRLKKGFHFQLKEKWLKKSM